jgi:hypothetical protein
MSPFSHAIPLSSKAKIDYFRKKKETTLRKKK